MDRFIKFWWSGFGHFGIESSIAGVSDFQPCPALVVGGGGWWWVVGVLSLLAGSASSTGVPVLVLANRATSKEIKDKGGRGNDGEEGSERKANMFKDWAKNSASEWTPTIPLLSFPTFAFVWGEGPASPDPQCQEVQLANKLQGHIRAGAKSGTSSAWHCKRATSRNNRVMKLLNFRLFHFLEDRLDMVRRFDIFM